MNVSKRFPQIPHGAEFAPKALYLLSAKKVPDEVRQEALRISEKGERITPERAKMLIAQYENLQNREAEIPHGAEFEISEPIEIRLTPQDRKDIQILIESGEKPKRAEEIITALRHVKRKAAQEIRSKRTTKTAPIRFTTKIKEPLRSLDTIAKQKGETLEEFLHEIVRNYKKRYR